MATIESPESGLRVGRLLKAHGLKGAIKLELYTDDPNARFVPGSVYTLQVPADSPWFGKTLTLTELRWYNSHPVVFFDGVVDRDGAESLAKAILWIDESSDARPAEDDAWYDHELVGVTVRRDGVTVGTVARVDHMPAQDLLIVTATDGREVMVPFVKAIVTSVDMTQRVMDITPPTGLFEEIVDDGPDETYTGTSARVES
ncbi:16S rRNA processing protein RimM [Microbacteriaceae bacterium MWH-Ta3]|nr:16S rRNA processing protein RimM [Microbacteriaceae bacterium MWH-Ta3]